MKKLIEYQAAIDALDKRFESFIKRFGYGSYEKADEKTKLVCDGISEAMDAIMDLPSATDKNVGAKLGTNLAEAGTDCISRQAAISAICNACGKIDCDKMDKCEKLQLPPANCSEFPNNSDTISRQAAIDEANAWLLDCLKVNKQDRSCGLIRRLEDLPSAHPKRGKWLPDNNNYIYEQYVCSECKDSFRVDTCMGKPRWNFCPNCGADMRGEQDG